MKLYISADIEGCTGIVSFSQCGRASGACYDYPFARRMMTEDLNAVVRGARSAGVDRVVVKDGHGNCKNLLIDELEPGVELITGCGPATDGMMDGIGPGFDAAMLIGYHGMAGAQGALMEHALVGGLHRLWVNGRPAGEIYVNSAVAGEFGVPTVMVSSDRAGCEEAQRDIPGVVACSTKDAFGKYMGEVETPSATRTRLEASAREAIQRARTIEPVTVPSPTCMRIAFRTTEEADMAERVPGISRADGYGLEWTSHSFLEAHRLAVVVFQMSIQGRKSEA
ncbi:MAG TPA: M55 family metallopeptidase [Fimbriimonas sp.]|nr:M55 family metallopeptidase [Fimbriimonas sp.]